MPFGNIVEEDGNVALMFGVVYSAYRFCIEFIRDDNLPLFDSLTISQNISIVIFIVSALLLAIRSKVNSQDKLQNG